MSCARAAPPTAVTWSGPVVVAVALPVLKRLERLLVVETGPLVKSNPEEVAPEEKELVDLVLLKAAVVDGALSAGLGVVATAPCSIVSIISTQTASVIKLNSRIPSSSQHRQCSCFHRCSRPRRARDDSSSSWGRSPSTSGTHRRRVGSTLRQNQKRSSPTRHPLNQKMLQ